jgi:hypothetical protein
MDKFVLRLGHRRVADARRYARAAFIVLGWVLAQPLFGTAEPSTFVGLQLPPYPRDCKVSEGAVLGSGPPYRLGYEHLICGSDHFVILQRLIGRRGDLPLWQVVDEVRPSVSPEQRLWGVLACQWAVGSDAPVFAVGTSTSVTRVRSVAGKLTQAWRFDVESEKIEAISPSDVSCAEEGDD